MIFRNNNFHIFLFIKHNINIIERSDYLWNFIDKYGNYLSNKWFVRVYEFIEGFVLVQREDNLYNLINKKGNYISDEWYKDVYKVKKGYTKVQRINGDWGNIDKYGNFYKF